MSLRRLLHVTMPLPDEPFDSWVEFMAHSYGATVGEMARALGLSDSEGVPAAASQSSRAWSTALEPQHLRNLELTTGRSGDEFRAMTRTTFAANAIRLTPQGRISASCPATGVAARYCPECLADSGGRWRLSWQFPFGFACPRHKRLLVDRCPGCGQPPRLLAHPLTLVPEPGHCHNRPPTESPAFGARCGADLTSSEEFVAAEPETREAQRAILRVIATGVGEFGIYAGGPPSTVQVLSDMLLLSRAGRQALVDGEHFEWMPAGQADVSPIASHKRTGKIDLRPSAAREVALGNTLAFVALQSGDRITDLLRGRVSVHTALDHYSPPLRDHVSRALGRARRPTATLQAVTTSVVDPAARAAKLPAVLWSEWTSRLAPRRLDAEIAGGALAAAVVFVGTRLTHGSAIKLLDSAAQGRQVSHVMRSLGRNAPEADTIRAIARLAALLDETSTPIDFARRRVIDYSGILPRDEWHEICRTANVLAGGDRRWQTARAHLYALLSGNRVARAPFAQEASFPAFTEVRSFRDGLPEVVSRALNDSATAFLKARHIDEPVEWMPHLNLAGFVADVPASGGSEWPQARPARAVVKPTRAVAAYSAGRSVREIAFEHGVARQTVSRVLEDAGVETRIGRRRVAIDVDWLRRRYVDERHTIPEIAAEVGVTMTTINRHLEAAGIPRRARGSASRATAIRVDPRAGDSPLLRRILVGQDATQRAERFLIVARHATMTAAATELGVTLSILANQMRRIGVDAGGPLIQRAFRGQPLALTELGLEVRHALSRAFEISEGEDPAPPAGGSQ
ncbi:transposase-like protein [Microbacterium marinum]|uniref:Transposase-like protein n=1 Tax=Microbacterium marinum TaxID=421115 RepID=A0A7W7BQ82_9MICO|nr:TniQ family protein [Microbacterium marinum]MBB4665749.1 transposase-like protein [Microbacterium marinum]